MSRSRKGQKLDLKLNLALMPSRVADEASPHGCLSSPSASSCLSAEPDRSPMSPEATSSMVLAGCPRCLMYVMLSEDDKKCPKCASTVLLDFFHASAGGTATTRGSKHVNKKTRMSWLYIFALSYIILRLLSLLAILYSSNPLIRESRPVLPTHIFSVIIISIEDVDFQYFSSNRTSRFHNYLLCIE